ncbi:DUF2339 domain-containing protein [Duganella sp. BJB488]|uniref:DUF2339 domain-containing protein n=1 Tax=unclassified Duganella TaxID=2636909 RepID=UPI000E346DAB|nr:MULTISPECIES: DUF2339 domain-containing protein [unclassified Duganella]RFP14071.1 DUF2339 domain-containing protein [Duganella sp. BJB489]RFP17345.1 DUF2339 domain-containing protein [Duganella sp. BJB488]RFP31865.1 DUF2339 domain-containing protein [Duganella sp. BJB480]
MGFLSFIFSIFTLSIAWRARTEARQARKIATELQREVDALREAQTTMQRVAAPPAAQPARPPAPASTDVPTPTTILAPPPPPLPPQVLVAAKAPAPVAAPKPEAAPTPAEPLAVPPEPVQPPPPAPAPQPAPAPRHEPTPPPRWLLAAKAWLFGGNLVAKLGLLILFIGVSFLLKYAAARVTVPIEFRLAGIVLADIALLAWGWRIRLSRPAIALPVQGAALAVLMLVTFGAFRLYQLIPGSLAFALLFVLTVFTCLLAVLQDAMWLAIFGIVGGFAAPILASTGGGSHIGLFSYYALLNAGVFALALLRSWRPLNLLGFAFTFAIGTAWGVLRYAPENYLSVQLFLLLFFAFYVSIPLAYARRQSVKLKNYVDGTLVFGTPMLGFGLQFSLVHGYPFGVAYSALALGLFYIGLATVLRRRDQVALLADAFLALGIVFGTLAMPFALDGRWTSAAWALEGAGIVWIGLRQKQKLAWMFGLLVQAGAWLSFFGTVSGLSPERAMESNLWLGFILLSLTAFLMATRFRAQQDAESKLFTALAALFLTFASVWLIAGAWTEIFLRTDGASQANLLVLSALVAAATLYFIARKMAWRLASGLALIAQAVAGVMVAVLALGQWNWTNATPDLFDRPILGAAMICAGALFSAWALMRHDGRDPGTNSYGLSRLAMLWAGGWWFALILPDLAGWLSIRYQLLTTGEWRSDDILGPGIYGMLVAAGTVGIVALARRLQWRSLRALTAPAWVALAAASALMLGSLYLGNRLPAASTWLAYAALWLAGEWLLRVWPASGWTLRTLPLQLLHIVRTGGPWLMIWPVAAIWITRWLHGADSAEAQLLADSGWEASASWARFIPAWLMMAAVGWMMQRGRSGGWPVAPLAAWYRRRLIPLACGWALLLVAVWNLTQNGAMAPLPYVPLLNPLDLTTCFAMLMAYGCYRLLRDMDAGGALRKNLLTAWPPNWVAPLPLLAALGGYGWLNLALLRTVSNYMHVPYEFDAMFASQFVQAMLSLVWSVTALLMMRYAARRVLRAVWIGGAVLLAMVVAKLFLVDLSNVGGVERIVSFVGVGALMVGIGYLAPYPSETEST